MVSRVIPVDPFDLVLFGATGDLARRKILPALFHRFQIGQFSSDCRILGTSRSELTAEEFRNQTADAIREFGQEVETSPKEIASFTALLDYAAVDARGDAGWDEIRGKLRDDAVRAFYLSVGPSLFTDIASRLSETGIATSESRIVLEKPFGHDLASAQALNAALREHFEEQQIYRIDHYLGKETVQNLMALRFANSLFEPLWNSSHIDHVQITVAESIGVEGRGEYYDKSGAMRDMVQNHLMQLLCLTAMEPPAQFTPNSVRDEKVKVIEALRPVPQASIARGQYRSRNSARHGDGYRDHAGNSASRTESYIALKVEVANWRWAGTPFYLRTGKRLRERVSEIAVYFRDPPHNIFEGSGTVHGNVLVIRLQPDEGITLKTTIKDPGPGGMRLTGANLDMTFADELAESGRPQDAYERLIMDVIRGNQTLFMRGDEVEAAWAWADPIIAGWQDTGDTPQPYDSGSAGPDDSLLLIHRDGRRWRSIGD
ncbi:glucose-6-phosphate dehydrogenase [Leisingera sp. ANG-M7]|uniref:glucose-6-phosphate dehydrogenase n=1 Tax=Leisingera sp. ANG-M7 TaxID=1577902 RepID=UPI00057E50D3|nr:glucose-6-phosphate dehydrogenase [Leisingera sp. ANG-M7]KIC37852.1 glucose-6-phosphate dehydrogenase [Leisingera sp. ANG-M7]